MRLRNAALPLAAALVSMAAVQAPARSEPVLNLPPHPRIIVYGTGAQASRLQELRDQVDEAGPPEQWSERKRALVLAFRSLRAASWIWNGVDIEAEWEERPINQDGQYRCVATLALTDLLMKDKGPLYPEYSDGRAYAAKANAFLHWWRDHGNYNWGQNPYLSFQPVGLDYAELLAGYALFYDWCYDYLSLQERIYHARAIYHLMTDAEHMYQFPMGDWRYGWYDNNHIAVVFGAVGLAGLALDQGDPIFNATARDSIAWYRRRAASRVHDYLTASFPGDGAGIEGVFYSMYGLNLSLPYVLATERLSTVGSGFDPLPADQRVDGPQNAYQAPTWLYYEQLPFNTCGGTPLNDTAAPPDDINPSFRSWPWLMAFSTSSSPNLGTPFFYTIYPPSMIDAAVRAPFDYRNPDALSDPFDMPQVTGQAPKFAPSDLNNLGILLGWPETNPYPALDPRLLPKGRYFSGRGITYFRTGVQLLKPDGSLDWKPDSCLITFECRQHPTYGGAPHWYGHTQQDVNHFTLFLAGQPLFYDSGYSGWQRFPSFFSSAHSIHEVKIGTGQFHGFASDKTMGTALTSAIGAGYAASTAGGINTECWPQGEVVRSLRRIVVLPRPGRPAPYIFLYDDFQLSTSGKVRALMQTGNAYVGGSINAPVFNGSVARWDKGNARAVLAFLSPASMTLSRTTLTPNDPVSWPPHWVVRAEVPLAGTRHQIVSMVEPRVTGETDPELLTSYTAIQNDDPEGAAYQVDSGRFTDVVAFRPADHVQDWTIYPVGYPPIHAGAAPMVAVRFDGQGASAADIYSATMSGSGTLYCGGSLVASCEGNDAVAVLCSNDSEALWMDAMQGTASSDGVDPAPATRMEPEVCRVPNPLRVGALLEWSGREQPVAIEIYDLGGRLLRRFDQGDGANGLRARWDGRTTSGGEIAAGVYLVRILEGRSIWSRKVLITR